jgi:SAM-dependent methyltransferase
MAIVSEGTWQPDPAAHGPGGGAGGQDYSLYGELAGWWPLISPLAEYAEDAAAVRAVFAAAGTEVLTLLDLGSGGGHMALHLAGGRSMTLVDLSQQMLAVSRQLNPDCEHIQGDMLTIRLGRDFDAVLVHDAVDYVTTTEELRQVIRTAFDHCRPGGIAVFAPDHTAEEFHRGSGGGGGHDGSGRLASFRERTSDPDPADDWILAEYEFTLRADDGTVRVVPEAHRLGCFRRATWLELLTEAGFQATALTGLLPGRVRLSRVMFTGRRPAAGEEAGSEAARTVRGQLRCAGAGRFSPGWRGQRQPDSEARVTWHRLNPQVAVMAVHHDAPGDIEA